MTNPYLESISIDDLSPEFCLVAKVIGIDNARKLMQNFPGTWVYVPTAQRIQRAARRYITERYCRFSDDSGQPDNAREIASQMGMTVTYVRRCAREALLDGRTPEHRCGPP